MSNLILRSAASLRRVSKDGCRHGRSKPPSFETRPKGRSSEREKEWNLGWQGRMTLRDRSPGGNFDSRLPRFGVEYSTFWGLSTPSGDSFTRSQDEDFIFHLRLRGR